MIYQLCPLKSGRQDSNLRPPGPKPGAITGLRYAPKPLLLIALAGCKNKGGNFIRKIFKQII